MTEWVKVPDYQPTIGTECMVCGSEINLGYCTNQLVPMICEECKEAIKYAKKLMKGQETHKFFVDESGKVTPLPVVVRCKDCEHIYFASNRVPDERSYVCEKHGIDIVQDWFCADGKKKENVLYHCNCPHCVKDCWSENAFPHKCSFCGKELT